MKARKTNKKKILKNAVNREQALRVWVNPNSSFKGPRGNRAWDGRQSFPPTVARLLELADVALGSVQSSLPSLIKKKRVAA